MSTILHGDAIALTVHALAGETRSRLLISSAFCTVPAIETLARMANPAPPDTSLIVRWRLSDFLTGASDPRVYETCKARGWPLYAHNDLHAKSYIFDKEAVVTSANLTMRGMKGRPPQGNIEIGYLVTAPNEVADLARWYKRIQKDSYLIDDALHAFILEQIATHELTPPIDDLDGAFQRGLKTQSIRTGAYRICTQHFFWTEFDAFIAARDQESTPEIGHDLKLLGLTSVAALEELRAAFEASRAFEWIDAQIETETYFGALTANLHNCLADDPSPYRQTVKSLLANLITWVGALCPDRFEISIPEHSQKIVRRA